MSAEPSTSLTLAETVFDPTAVDLLFRDTTTCFGRRREMGKNLEDVFDLMDCFYIRYDTIRYDAMRCDEYMQHNVIYSIS